MNILLISIWSFLFNTTEQKKEPELYKLIVFYIKANEGLRLKSYKCTAGASTIGWGHKNIEGYKKLSLKEADALFLKDFNKRYDKVKSVYPQLSRERHLIITALYFNVGDAVVSKNTKLYKYLKNQNKMLIKLQILKYNIVNSKAADYLTKRRKFEASLFDLNVQQWESKSAQFKKIVVNQIKQAKNG